MKPAILLAFVLLSACGAGAAPPSEQPVLVVIESVPPPLVGWTSWDEDGVRIALDPSLDPVEMLVVLQHEIWHALTLHSGHFDVPGCSCAGAYPSRPCAEDLESVEGCGPITLDFPDDPGLLALPSGGVASIVDAAATWWNDALGRTVVEVTR